MYSFIEPTTANVFNLVLDSNADSFKLANVSAATKTIVITNPFLVSDVTIKYEHRVAATITYPSSVTWKDANAPVYTLGKIYFIYLTTDNGGTTYQGTWTGSW